MNRGAVAAGHEGTAEAAAIILEAGGNAFDAALAALCSACVVEPVLCSLGGGGFLLARQAGEKPRLFDFFVQTPKRKRPAEELEFYPIQADFGVTRQEFHIGLGTIAVPGIVRGLFDIHQRLGRLPMRTLVEPAIGQARLGIPINRLQASIFRIVEPIYLATSDARRVYASPLDPGRLPREGERFCQPELADSLEILAIEGPRLFYEGEMAKLLVEACRHRGGHLTLADLKDYRTIDREPLTRLYRGARICTNPPPSAGGMLISFALALLDAVPLGELEFGAPEHLGRLAQVMELTNLARAESAPAGDLLRQSRLDSFRRALAGHPLSRRGTTHISVIDHQGNAVSLSLSNGEGCGWLIPGAGIMLNNMLGEEDLNPGGFHQWEEDRRVASMMAPTLAMDADRLIALGSGGSNRLRTAILQVLCNLIDFQLGAEAAVTKPRIHVERGLINIEPGFSSATVKSLCAAYPEHQLWSEPNLFFGGTHTLVLDRAGFSGAGDPRRGGVFRLA